MTRQPVESTQRAVGDKMTKLESLIKERDTLEEKLQKLIDRDTMVPPPIRHSAFLSAVKRLDRLDSEIAQISQQVYDLRGTK